MPTPLASVSCLLDRALLAAGAQAIRDARLRCVVEVCLDVQAQRWEPRVRRVEGAPALICPVAGLSDMSRSMRLDLPGKARAQGVPVLHVEADAAARALALDAA